MSLMDAYTQQRLMSLDDKPNSSLQLPNRLSIILLVISCIILGISYYTISYDNHLMDTSMTAEQDITQFHSVAIGINGEIIRDENCTICELRKSKANIGDFSTISHFLKKLKNKQCTTSLILGGSISTGHGVKNHSNLYYNKVAEFLNDKFQCLNGNISSKHIMISFSKVARGSDYHLANLYSIRDYPRTFDLIFLDVTLNDITDNTKYSVSSGHNCKKARNLQVSF
eukprot:233247_1